MSDGKVVIDTLLDSSGFEKGLGKLSSAAKSGIGIATKAIAAAGTALTAAGSLAVKVGSDFEEGMSKVSAISGAAGEELEALKAKAKEMGATTKFSATESAEALQYMAMAGWKTEQMISGLPGIMNLAAASGEDLASVSDIVTDALTAFGLEASDSAHFADVLAKAASSSNTNVGLMGNTFQYVAPLAGAMKYSIEDTAVAIGLMANAGIKGEKSGTALRSLMTRLVKPTDDSAEAMEKLGIKITNSDGTMKPLNVTISELRSSFSKLTDSEKAEYASLLAGQEAMSGLLAIVNASESDFQNLTRQINSADGAAESMAETMNDNLKGQVTILKSALEGLGIEIYESVDNPLKAVAISAQESVNKLTDAYKKGGFSELAKEAGTIIADALTRIAQAAPKMITAGADAIKSFLIGIKNNAPALRDAAIDIVKALADGVASLLPKELGNACKTLINLATKVAKPLLNLAGAAIKTASSLSGLAIAIAAAVAAYKGYKTISTFVKTLNLVRTGAMFVAQSTTMMTAAQKANTVITTLAGVKNTLLAGTTTAMSLAQKAAVVSTNLLNVALTTMGGPIGIVVAAIGLLVGAAMAFSDSSDEFTGALDEETRKTEELAEAQKKCSDAIKENKNARAEAVESAEVEAGNIDFLYQKLQELNDIEDKSAAQKAQMKAVVDQLNEVVPELGLAYNEETDALNKSTEEVYKAITAQKNLVLAKAAQEQMAESAKDMVKVELELSKAEKERETTAKKLQKAQENLKAAEEAGSESRWRYWAEVKTLTDSLEEQDETIKNYKKELSDLGEEYDDLAKTATKNLTSDDIDSVLNDLCKKAGIKAKDIPKSVSDGIKEGSYMVPQSIDELNNLIKYDDLVSEAEIAGIDIPKKISEGAMAGGDNLAVAIDELSKLVTFGDLVEKARIEGKNIPVSLVNGINEGKLPIPQTMEELNKLVDFNSALESANLAGDNIPKFLSEGLINGSLTVDEAVTELGEYINFEESIEQAEKDGIAIPEELAEQVRNGEVSVRDAQKTLNEAIIREQGKLPEATDNAGKKALSALNNALANGKSGTGNIAKDMLTHVRQRMKEVGFEPVGKGVTDGVIKGMSASSVIGAAEGVANSALIAAKNKLGIKSPSRVFRDQVGAMVPRGMAIGIESEGKTVANAVEDVVDNAVSAADTSEIANKLSLNPLEIDAMYDRAQQAVLFQASRMSAPVQEFITQMVPFDAGGINDENSNAVYEIHIHSHIGAKEVAEETVVFTDSELGMRNRRKERGNAG